MCYKIFVWSSQLILWPLLHPLHFVINEHSKYIHRLLVNDSFNLVTTANNWLINYNLGNTTLVLIYNNKKTKLKTQYLYSRWVSNFYLKKRRYLIKKRNQDGLTFKKNQQVSYFLGKKLIICIHYNLRLIYFPITKKPRSVLRG